MATTRAHQGSGISASLTASGRGWASLRTAAGERPGGSGDEGAGAPGSGSEGRAKTAASTSTSTGRRRRWRLDRGGLARAPRILFVNQYYSPDTSATAQYVTELAEHLARAGYECHVVCSRRGYKDSTGRRLPKRETRDGVHIHRVSASAFGRKGLFARMTDYLSYYATAGWKAATLPRPDLTVTLTTPPIIALVGIGLRTLKGSRHLYWSMDLHPDASFALGKMSRRGLAGRFFGWLSDWAYRRADRVVALGPWMAERLRAKGVSADRLETVGVWGSIDEVEPIAPGSSALRRSWGLSDRDFVAMYSGNHGLAHSFDEFLEAARRLRGRPEFKFAFVGGGPRFDEARRAREEEGLENLILSDYQPREALTDLLGAADVHLISMREEMRGIVVPSKLYGNMASARPVIFVGPRDCETAEHVLAADCGEVCALGDADAVVSALTGLADDPERRARLGANGRRAFLERHESRIGLARLEEIVAGMIGRPQGARPRAGVAAPATGRPSGAETETAAAV